MASFWMFRSLREERLPGELDSEALRSAGFGRR
jgi:hypothetical protein